MKTKNIENTNFSCSKDDFGEDFLWGVSSSAFQTEGGHNKDGKGLSIWDEFSNKKNVILKNESPSIATNFYENYKEDIELIKQLGIPNFRFSLSWSRIIPNGIGEINQAGIDYYHNVLDTCIENKIEPFVTLYHWDLPLELEKKGGWTNRDILNWFEEYVAVCVNAFKGKVKYWMVLNEPSVFTGAGYFLGIHAPGKKGLNNFLPAMHHAILCQSVGFNKIKQIDTKAQVGTTFSCTYVTPKTYADKDLKATDRVDALLNKLFIEPSLGLGYPLDALPFLKHLPKYIVEGDDNLIKVDFDFIGLQNYTREVVAYNSYIPYLNAKIIPANKRKVDCTSMNWEVYPSSIYHMIKKFSDYKEVRKIIITENGASFPDILKNDAINDLERKHFLQSYIQQVLNAKQAGGKVIGYFVWSLTDNFEWAEGYKHRFGLIHVDFDTQKRTIKNSGFWYRNFLLKKPTPLKNRLLENFIF